MTVDSSAVKPLRRKLGNLRQKLKALYLGYGTVRLLQLTIAGIMLTFLMDWFLDLPRWVRAFHASLAIVVGAITFHRFLLFPLTRKLEDEELAILVESKNPEFRDQIISALQLSRQAQQPDFSDSKPLVSAMVEKATKELANARFGRLADRRRILRSTLLAALGAASVLVFAGLYPAVTSIYVQRNIGLQDIPWPQKTFLEVMVQEGENIQISVSGSMNKIRLARGTDLKINVKANGQVPTNVELCYENQDRSIEDRRAMNRIGDRDFTYQFLALTQSFYFHVEGGDDDDSDPLFWVDVQPTPRVKEVKALLTPPVYTRIEPTEIHHGNIEAPEGSLIRLEIETSMPVSEAILTLGDQKPLKLASQGGNTSFVASLVLEESLTYSFELLGANKLRNRDPLRYSLTAIPDTDPRIHLSLPGVSDLDATEKAVVPIKVQVNDDYGVEEAWLSLKLGQDLEELKIPFKTSDLVAVERADSGDELVGFLLLDFETLQLPSPPDGAGRKVEIGDRIRYLAVSKDGNANLSGEPTPNFGTTSENRISIVTRIELERRLEELRRRLREDVRKLQKKQLNVQEKVLALAAASHDGSEELSSSAFDPAEREAILDAEVTENRLFSDGKRLSTDLARIFDVHLFNRLEESSLTENVIASLFESFREPSDDPLSAYRKIIADHARGSAGDSDQIGKMVTMLRVLFRASFERIPEASKLLKQARSTVEKESRRELLGQSAEAQRRVLEDLELLLNKMEEWEDFQSLVQMTRDVIESQEGIRTRTRGEILPEKKPDRR